MSREPRTPRGLFHNDGDDGVVHARCPDCGGDVGVNDCGDACAFRALDDAEIEAADAFTDPEAAEVADQIDDFATARLIDGSGPARQNLTERAGRVDPQHVGLNTSVQPGLSWVCP